MQVLQEVCSDHLLQTWDPSALQALNPQLVLVFGSVNFFDENGFADTLGKTFPGAAVVGCSTAGEITRLGVREMSCVITALHFDHTAVKVAQARAATPAESQAAGKTLARQLEAPDLNAILLFSKGLNINGSALIDGVLEIIDPAIPIAGGLAGDSGAFRQTFVLSPSGISDDQIVAVGLYGNRLKVSCGSFGGWEPFGPTRKVTRAQGNILYELDGEPALNTYKRYLGDYARDLPASGLLFPFEMLNENHDAVGIIRTILGVDEEQGSLILAGTIDEQSFLRLMHASPDSLVRGAEHAALAATGTQMAKAEFALLVSCVGRKLVMGDQTDEEIDIVAEQLPGEAVIAGFYSYGEICPLEGILKCSLHNQTMTITLLSEE